MDNCEIRVKMSGGYLVARRNPDIDYDGIDISFETDDGVLTDVVTVECPEEYNRKRIDVYCYENPHHQDFTRKYTITSEDIFAALSEQ